MSEIGRPDPDALLATIRTEEQNSTRGRMKVFFGASPGVGKTYAMLEDARRRAGDGEDVLVGYAEPHIRPDTEALLLGLEILPYKIVSYRGTQLKELDLDAALAAKPSLILIDELAHSNAPGMRHAKRFQDVMELLGAGINVYTTLNVQHLESVNDIVERVTGVKVRETLPDWVFEQAGEVQLVDIPPERLLSRLAEGKVYRGQQAENAARNFFSRGNLMALRELALRRTAERVDAEMEHVPPVGTVSHPGAASERILVCVGPSPFSIRLVRAARRMATALRTQFVAVYVETPRSARLSPDARERIAQALRLTRQLGGQPVTLSGTRAADEILAYARQRSVARIVVGKPQKSRWTEMFTGSFVDALIRKSGPVDIYVMRDETLEPSGAAASRGHPAAKPVAWAGYAWAVAATAVTALLGVLIFHRLHFSNINVLMLYLVVVLAIAWRFGRGPATVTAVLGVLLFDYTVVKPYYSFAVSDTQYFFTFAVMLATGLLISALTDTLRRQTELARRRERRTAALFELGRELSVLRERDALVQTAAAHLGDVFSSDCAVLLPDENGNVRPVAKPEAPAAEKAASVPAPGHAPNADAQLDEKEIGVAQWAYSHHEPAGATTNTLASAKGLYVPLRAAQGSVGVLALFPKSDAGAERLRDPDRLQLLEAFAAQIALAVERVNLAADARRAWERAESEFLRNTLLATVSHDLRTPLAAITGTATSLLSGGQELSPAVRNEMLGSIADESERMERLIGNLLDMTRLESGSLQLKKEWFPLPEIIVSAVQREEKRLKNRPVDVGVPPDFPLLFVDGLLMEQVFMNLLDNAVEYTPADSPVEIAASTVGGRVVIDVKDHGPGIAGDPSRLFEKFYRGPSLENRRGMGLGLAICQGVLKLHDGAVEVINRSDGATFRLTLPLPPPAPKPAPEERRA